MDRFITITVAAEDILVARKIAEIMGQPGMFLGSLYYTGQVEVDNVVGPVHVPGTKVAFMSSGLIPEIFVDAWLRGPDTLLKEVQGKPAWTFPDAAVASMWNKFYCRVSEESADAAQARMGASVTAPV